MDRQQLDTLHQQASTSYLKGDVSAAMDAWRRVLEVEPGDERALEGVRLCEQVAGCAQASVTTSGQSPFAVSSGATSGASPPSPADSDPFAELEAKLSFGNVAAEPAAPSSGDDGFLDLSDLASHDDASTERSSAVPRPSSPVPRPAPDLVPTPPEVPAGAGPAADAPAAGATGWRWDAAESTASVANAATLELRRRVNELLANALVFMEQGRKGEALKTLDRLLILDDENEAATALKERIEQEIDAASPVDPTRQTSPSERSGAAGDATVGREGDCFDPGPLETIELASGPAADAVPDLDLDPDAEFDPDAGFDPDSEFQADEAPTEEDPGVATPPAAVSSRPAFRSRSTIWVFAFAAVVVLGTASYLLIPRWLAGSDREAPPVDPAAAAAAEIDAALAPVELPLPEARSPAPEPEPASPKDELAQAIDEGERAMAEGNYALAVISFDRALGLRPDSAELRGQLNRAADRYREQQEIEAQWQTAKDAFASGNYKESLRLLYRLPPTEDRASVERYLANGWYNLGVLALKAADCQAARSHLAEARTIRSDEGIESAARLARDCGGERSTSYLLQVDALRTRAIDD